MVVGKLLAVVVVVLLLAPIVLSKNKTSKEWAQSAQKSIWEVSQVFHRSTIGLGSFNKAVHPKLIALSQSTAKVAGAFGVFGALFSIVMTFIPGSDSDSPELKLMKSEFGKLSQKMDTVAKSLDDTKELIKLANQKAAYIGHEHKIHRGYQQLQICLQQIQRVNCSAINECKRKRSLIIAGFISSMNVFSSVDTILRGATSDSAFGESLLNLLREESECNVPKINLLANKIAALITKGMTVTMFHDLMTKTEYNVMDGTVLVDKMLRTLESKREAIQHWCFAKINYWMPLDIENAKEHFTSDVQVTNTKLLRTLKAKYPWIYWHVVSYKGKQEPETWPSTSPRRLLYSSSEVHNVSCFAIPTNTAKVENLRKKTVKWKNILTTINSDPERGVQDIENRMKKVKTLNNQIQFFAIIRGEQWVLGHFNDTIQHHTLGVDDVSSANVFVTRPPQGFVVAVTFLPLDHPFECKDACNGNGKCYVYPYSPRTGCRCKPKYSGEECESSGTSLKLTSAINSILEKTMKLPTFASIQHSIEDTQLYLKTSTKNIQKSITKLGEKIDEQFKSLGEFMSNKFDWFAVLLKYKDAIENLNYFHSISSDKISRFEQNSSIPSSTGEMNKIVAEEDKDIARFLLSPTGIRKWLYQINFLIVGRRDSQFNSHKPLLFMVMDKYKNRICLTNYKKEITRTYRQLMLLQLQGYMLWSNAYSIEGRDSSSISEMYAKVLENQRKYLQNATCQIRIPHSTNLRNCTDGFFFHKSLEVDAICRDGYFAKGKYKEKKEDT